MTSEQLIRLIESLRRDKATLMICLNDLLGQAALLGNIETVTKIRSALHKLENSTFEPAANANA